MFPFGWEAGERQLPAETFKQFQAFSGEAMDVTVRRLRQRGLQRMMDSILWDSRAANDNETNDAVNLEVDAIIISPIYTSMLLCWQACGRDMLKAKLAWDESNMNTWTLDSQQ